MKGFTIFFAILIASLALAIGLAIYDLTVRELNLTATATQSQFAIYAADTGAECALYWDAKYNGTKSAFATSTNTNGGTFPPTTGIVCNQQDVAAAPWTILQGSNFATTTFTLQVSAATTCATVEVGKFVDAHGTVYTDIVSHGYNTCVAGARNQLERVFQINY